MTPTEAYKYSSMITSGIVAACAGAIFVIGGTEPEAARSHLAQHRYTSIETTGKSSIFSCHGPSVFRTEFRASANGQIVEGTVCRNPIPGFDQSYITIRKPAR